MKSDINQIPNHFLRREEKTEKVKTKLNQGDGAVTESRDRHYIVFLNVKYRKRGHFWSVQMLRTYEQLRRSNSPILLTKSKKTLKLFTADQHSSAAVFHIGRIYETYTSSGGPELGGQIQTNRFKTTM